MKISQNRPFASLNVGETAEITRICTIDDLYAFAGATGNHNPLHLAAYDGDGDGRAEAVAPALWHVSLLAAILGNILPGAGTRLRHLDLHVDGTAEAGDELHAKIRILEKRDDGDVVFQAAVTRELDDTPIISGTLRATPPDKALHFDAIDVPGLIVQRHRHFEALLARAEEIPPMRTAVVAPEDPNALGGAFLAQEHGLIVPILVGDPAKIAAAARALGRDLAGLQIVPATDHRTAAQRAVDLIQEDAASALMKGHLHTDTLLRAVLRTENNLRIGQRLSHVFVMDVPGVMRPILVTDAAINIAPDLPTKVDITQNAIHLAHAIGIETPRVGILSAVETVNPQIMSSVDAALLAKMADRGQITGGIVDGPLAMDNAVDLGAARTKGIKSEVAGRADILVVPDIDAGNMLAKQLTYLSHADGAGIVLGAKVPIILTSRADDDASRLASCAVASLCVATGTFGTIPARDE